MPVRYLRFFSDKPTKQIIKKTEIMDEKRFRTLSRVKRNYGRNTCFFQNENGEYDCIGNDADTIGTAFSTPIVTTQSGDRYVTVTKNEVDALLYNGMKSMVIVNRFSNAK